MRNDNIENIPVKGVTWKQMIWVVFTVIGSLMTIEGTLLGIYYKEDSRITHTEEKVECQSASVSALRIDVDVLKVHQAGVDAEIRNIPYKRVENLEKTVIEMIIHRDGKQAPRNVPETWNELSGAQLLRVAELLFAEEEDPTRRDIRIMQALTGIDDVTLRSMSDETIAVELLPLFWWVTEGCDLTAQRLPVLPLAIAEFYGPADKLGNLRFTEWDHAERALHEWHQAPHDLQRLYHFVATLYRPAKARYDLSADPEGDVREEFNPNLTAKYAAMIAAEAAPGAAYAVLLFYKSCRDYITAAFPSVFSNPEANSSEEPGQPAYYGLIRSIAKTGTYGTFAEVEQMYLYNALMELEAAEDERVRMEEAINDAKRGNDAA